MISPMADHCVTLKCSSSRLSASKAATAGSMLAMMLKVCGGRRWSATLSKEIGMALESAATPRPTPKIQGEDNALKQILSMSN